jgi:hypothetical protein
MTTKEKVLAEIVESHDPNRQGWCYAHDFRAVLTSTGGLTDGEVDAILRSTDIFGGGEMSYSTALGKAPFKDRVAADPTETTEAEVDE